MAKLAASPVAGRSLAYANTRLYDIVGYEKSSACHNRIHGHSQASRGGSPRCPRRGTLTDDAVSSLTVGIRQLVKEQYPIINSISNVKVTTSQCHTAHPSQCCRRYAPVLNVFVLKWVDRRRHLRAQNSLLAIGSK